MPPSRFLAQTSKWRNAVATPGKPGTERYEELGTGYSGSSSSSSSGIDELHGAASLVKAGPWPLMPARNAESDNDAQADSFGYRPSAWVKGAAAGSLLQIALSAPGRKGKQAPSIKAAPGSIADFDVAPWWTTDGSGTTTLAAASGRHIQLTTITKPWEAGAQSTSTTLILETADSSKTNGVATVQWHPAVPSLLLSTAGSSVAVWDVNHHSSPALTTQADRSGITARHAAWASDGSRSSGSLIGASSSDGRLLLFDPRASPQPCAHTLAHASKVKPSRVAFSSNAGLILTTGFSLMRQREICVWDPRSLSSGASAQPLEKIVLTDSTSPSVLSPVIDVERNIAYLLGRGDTSVRWLELDASSQFNQGAHALGPGCEASGPAALVPQTLCDVMSAEIDRLLVPVGGALDGILPLRVNVPRRQLIDYHDDLFPLTSSYHSRGKGWETQRASSWLNAGQEEVEPLAKLSREPDRYQYQIKQLVAQAASPSTGATSEATVQSAAPREGVKADIPPPQVSAASNGHNQQVEAAAAPSATHPAPAATSAATSSAASQPSAAVQAPQTVASASSQPSAASPLSSKAPTAASAPPPSSQRPHWSRRFLAGSTPLIAAHQNLSALDTSTSPDTAAFEVNPTYLAYPVAGPGGRIGFHPLSATGRMPLSPPSVRSTVRFVDFVADKFDDRRLITAAEDGSVSYWRLPPQADVVAALSAKDQTKACADLDVAKPEATLTLPEGLSSARIADLKAHPVASDLVSVALASAGAESQLVVLSSAAGTPALSVQVGEAGAFSHAWSSLGDLVAVACKDKKLRIVDPRGKRAAEAAAYDSPRPFKIVWLDQDHLITTGHGLGSMRSMKLFRVERSSESLSVSLVKTQTLDVSPSVLFPHYDPDTNVLLLWSKGERSVTAFEVLPSPPPNVDVLTPLPSFQAGSPQVAYAFLPKRCVDVKSIETTVAYRLSHNQIQRVGFGFSRARPELFQDDIFVPTRDTSRPLCSAAEWLNGEVELPDVKYVSLQPPGMIALSQAPAKTTVSKLPKGPIKKELTEKEREDGLLDSVFQRAKVDHSNKAGNSTDDLPQLAASVKAAPDDGDWSD